MPKPLASIAHRTITHIDGDQQSQRDESLATEEPLEIRIADTPIAITMRTPGSIGSPGSPGPPVSLGSPGSPPTHLTAPTPQAQQTDIELAAGFCLTEGIVQHADDIESIEACDLADYGNVVNVTLTDEAAKKYQSQINQARRVSYLSSSCGLCGKQSIDRIKVKCAPIEGKFTVSKQTLMQCPAIMRQKQETFQQTGGLHASALFATDGQCIVLREDIGRHNAVDKVIGHQLLLGLLPLDQHILLLSGRASFEILQKAALAGIACVAAVSAPSHLAVDFAMAMNITLVGFLRDQKMNIYHDAGRLT